MDKTFFVNLKVDLCIGRYLENVIVAMLIEPAIPKFPISFTRNSIKIVLFAKTCLTGDRELQVF